MENRKIQIEALLGAIFILLSSGLLIIEGFREGVGERTSLEEREIQQKAVSIETGAALYDSACAECHGTDGKGLIGAPLNDPHLFDLSANGRLAEVGWTGSLEDYIISRVAAGIPVSTRPEWPGKLDGNYAMPAWGEEFGGPLRPDQVRNLAAFIMNYEAEAVGSVLVSRDVPILGQTPEDKGRGVFLQQGCGSCHAIEGNSAAVGIVGPDLTNIAVDGATRIDGYSAEEYIRESILDPAAYIAPECPTGPCTEPTLMPLNFSEKISEEQLNNLVTYLLALGASGE
jgi:mono/diheme cytochrome c family protein